MNGLKATAKIDNLRRSWRWIRSNPDAAFKSHFRDLYSAYATADESLLLHLKDRLDRGIFEPSDACKIFLPKPSGILRPYTLLSIEDQVVYQAMANVVAEQLAPHVRSHYNSKVFGHLYAGSSGKWFYRKWTDGYRAFNDAAETAFKDGYTWTASFDLTAFYDSIDHNVLRYMLQQIGLDPYFCNELTKLLSKWTATTTRIYHDHGIPQGPLSSGLISEVVLRHFDDNHKTKHDVRYFRYVDDIRLFAKKEIHLRYALVALDRLSKDLGLFPQSGKIDIHLVKDIKEELKSVSSPIEPALKGPIPNQRVLRNRLAELSPRNKGYKVIDPTRFKYLLSRAKPSLRVLDRLWRIFEHAPHFYPQVSGYLQKFDSLPDAHADRLIDHIEKQELYPPVRAVLVRASIGRLSNSRTKKLRSRLKPHWKPRSNTPELSDALWQALHNLNHLTDRQIDYALLHTQTSWLRMKLHFGTPWDAMSAQKVERLLNESIRSQSADVSVSAAWLMAMLNTQVRKPLRSIHPAAKILLREVGKIRRADSKVCGINLAINEMTGKLSAIDWRNFFGNQYRQAEVKIVACKGYFKTNPTAWVNMLDVFNDLFADALFKKDGTVGARNLGNFGGVIGNKKLISKYPKCHDFMKLVHEKRLESELSHAVVKSTQAPTTRIPYKWLKTGSQSLVGAIAELEKAGF